MARPSNPNISRVADAVLEGASFSMELADWLDDFYYRSDANSLAEPPALLVDKHKDGNVLDAYLAATASHLSKRHGWPIPEWVWEKERIANPPWFADKHDFLRATLLLESPSSFRERNLFVSANALSRV